MKTTRFQFRSCFTQRLGRADWVLSASHGANLVQMLRHVHSLSGCPSRVIWVCRESSSHLYYTSKEKPAHSHFYLWCHPGTISQEVGPPPLNQFSMRIFHILNSECVSIFYAGAIPFLFEVVNESGIVIKSQIFWRISRLMKTISCIVCQAFNYYLSNNNWKCPFWRKRFQEEKGVVLTCR